MKAAKVVITFACAVLFWLAGFGFSREANHPEDALLFSEQINNPIGDVEIKVFRQVNAQGGQFCPCFILSAGDKSIEFIYSMMPAPDNPRWLPTARANRFEHDDVVILTGELATGLKNVSLAFVINQVK